jgi:serine/threonine-protein kinase
MSGRATKLGRYELFDEIASGGMATIHLGRICGAGGFSRAVAIKRLHLAHASAPEQAATLLDEARLASRIRHPNVLTVLDVVVEDRQTCIVAEYVHGESLHHLLEAAKARGEKVDPRIASAVVGSALLGLHAAHEATDAKGAPMDIVHRDVSPHNLMVDVDGVTRVVDFGIAKATGRLQDTTDGSIKGKLPYMAPEQLKRRPVSRRVDVYAAAVVLWETLAGSRLFQADNNGAMIAQILQGNVPPPSTVASVPAAVDAIVARATARDPAVRFATALEMAQELEAAVPPASPRELGEWVQHLAHEAIDERAALLRAVEESAPLDAVEEVASTVAASELATARPVVPWVVAGALAVAVIGALAVLEASRRAPAPTAVARAASSVVDVSTPAPAPSLSSTGAEPKPEPAPEPGAVASGVREDDRRGRAGRPKPKPPGKPASECDPRRYIDEQGHIHYDATCLR